MTVNFIERPNGPQRLVCDAEVVFTPDTDNPMAGLKLVGFSIWRSAENELFCSLPSRPFGAGGERRYFDLIRSTSGDSGPARRLRSWILEQYHAHGSAHLDA